VTVDKTEDARPLRYFFDTEFIEDGCTIDLISIGIVCEDGREFYMESSQVPWHRASDWVNENVRPHLRNEGQPEAEIAVQVVEFVNNGGRSPEFWAYYADYDWVVLCQLFGTMMDLPDGWPMFCMDIKQEAVRLGDPPLPEQTSTEHHALADARWNAEAYAFLTDYSGGMGPSP
jgi:hypothetical protein